jgi:hypothetical protein
MEHITKRYQIIQTEKIRNFTQPSAKKHATFFSKLSFVISSRILGEQIEIFAFNIMSFYLEYAHVWPALYSFRMWILQVCKDTISIKFDDKPSILKDLLDRLMERIRRDTQETMDGWNNLTKETVELYNDFHYEANLQINYLRLKKNKNILSRDVYQKYFDFMLNFEAGIESFKTIQTGEHSPLREWLRHGASIEKGLTSILQEIKTTFRFSVCNSSRFLTISEEESIMACIGNIIWKTVESKL